MDPLSVTASIASLVSTGLKSLQVYKQLHSLYTSADLTVVSLRTQCSCIDFALQEIQDIIVEDPETTERLTSDGRLAKNFDFVLGACHLAFSLLNENLSKLVDVAQNEYGQMHAKDKLKSMWNNREMKDLRNNIQGQAMAVNLLLTTLQAKSKAEVNQILLNQNSKDIFKKVADNASSISLHQRAKAEEDDETKQTATINSDITETEFNFDHEIINTPAYRRAFAAARRLAIPASQSSAEPPASNEADSSERRKLTRLNSKQPISQSIKPFFGQRGSSEVNVIDSSPKIGSSTAESPKTNVSSSGKNLALHGEKSSSAVHLHPHMRSTSDPLSMVVDGRSGLNAGPQASVAGSVDGPEPVAASPHGQYSDPKVSTPKDIIRRREERIRPHHQDTVEHKNGVLRPQENSSQTRTAPFPHALERWETLSSHWEGLTSYWLRRLEEGQTEAEDAPINQRNQKMARQITDLSAAGANLFSAVVELQRLRASSEREFQRWFFEVRADQERSAEAVSNLERRLQEEAEKRTTAEKYSTDAANMVQEMRLELSVSRDEARRAWEKLGRREQVEVDRQLSKRDQPRVKQVKGGLTEELIHDQPVLQPQRSQLATVVE